MASKWGTVRVAEEMLERIDAEVRRRRQADGGEHSRASVVRDALDNMLGHNGEAQQSTGGEGE